MTPDLHRPALPGRADPSGRRDFVLPDGRRILLRPLTPEDAALYPDFLSQVTAEDMRLRFFAPVRELNASAIERLTRLDQHHATAFAALDEAGHLVGVVRIHGDQQCRHGEFAILIRSDLKGQGLGWCMMQTIIGWTREHGFETIEGQVMRENTYMLALCRHLGFTIKADPEEVGILNVSMPLGQLDPAAALPA